VCHEHYQCDEARLKNYNNERIKEQKGSHYSA
jgi:hypothetical protein